MRRRHRRLEMLAIGVGLQQQALPRTAMFNLKTYATIPAALLAFVGTLLWAWPKYRVYPQTLRGEAQPSPQAPAAQACPPSRRPALALPLWRRRGARRHLPQAAPAALYPGHRRRAHRDQRWPGLLRIVGLLALVLACKNLACKGMACFTLGYRTQWIGPHALYDLRTRVFQERAAAA